MTDDEKRELIADARKAQRAVYLATDEHVAEDLSRIIRGLADALEEEHEDLEWEYVIQNGMGNSIYMAYSLREAPDAIAADQAGPGLKPKRSLMRRRKAGPWEVAADE